MCLQCCTCPSNKVRHFYQQPPELFQLIGCCQKGSQILFQACCLVLQSPNPSLGVHPNLVATLLRKPPHARITSRASGMWQFDPTGTGPPKKVYKQVGVWAPCKFGAASPIGVGRCLGSCGHSTLQHVQFARTLNHHAQGYISAILVVGKHFAGGVYS